MCNYNFFRKNIGLGLIIQSTNDEEVFLQSISRPVYVESNYLDREAMRTPGEACHTIYQNASIKVICFAYFLLH